MSVANKYRDPYYEYTDTTDEGMDVQKLTREQMEGVQRAKERWQAAYEAGDQAGMDAAHADAELLRAQAGYSGGANGGAYNPFADDGDQGAHASGTHMTSPTWTAPYQQEQADALQALLAQKPFTYDPETDPMYQQYADTYTRMGQKAMKDTLGALGGKNGGQVSSAATIAAQQANEAYMQELADKVPELRQLAYQMWMNEGDRLRSDLQMFDSLNSADAARWGSTVLDPFTRDRSFALDYDQYLAGRDDAAWEKAIQEDERAYAKERDAVADQRYENEREQEKALAAADLVSQSGDFSKYGEIYGLTQEEIQALNKFWEDSMGKEDRVTAANLLAQAGDFSRLGQLYGLTDQEVQALKAAYQQQTTAAKASAKSGSSSAKSGSGSAAQTGSGVLDALLSLGSEDEARRYLMSLGLSQWEYKEYLDLYRQSKTAQKSTGQRDDAAVRNHFAQLHPEMTGGEEGAARRAENTAKVLGMPDFSTKEEAMAYLSRVGLTSGDLYNEIMDYIEYLESTARK